MSLLCFADALDVGGNTGVFALHYKDARTYSHAHTRLVDNRSLEVGSDLRAARSPISFRLKRSL